MQTVLIQARCKPTLVKKLDQLVAQSVNATNRSDYIRWLIERELDRQTEEQPEAVVQAQEA